MSLPALSCVLVSTLILGSVARKLPSKSPSKRDVVRQAGYWQLEPKNWPTVVNATDFDPKHDAERLYKAMKGYGSNKDEIIDVLCYRSTAQRRVIDETFTKKYDYSFTKWLYWEITGWFDATMRAMMWPPHVMLAEQLRWATKGWGTDEKTIVDILVPIDMKELTTLETYYEGRYKISLWKHVMDDTRDNHEMFQRLIKALLKGRPSPSKDQPSRWSAKKTAKSLYNGGKMFDKSNWDNLIKILTNHNWWQMKLIFEEFQSLTGLTFERVVRDRPKMNYWFAYAAISIYDFTSNSDAYFAKIVREAVRWRGTDERALIRVIVWRAEKDLNRIKHVYAALYKYNGKTLAEDVANDTSGYFRKALLALLREK